MKERSGTALFTVEPDTCIRCGECVKDCPINIIVIGETLPAIAEGKEADCIGCQHCLAVCPTGSVSVLGLRAADSIEFTPDSADHDQLARLLKGRRSVRRYIDENVEPDHIRALLETARYAPSGRNDRLVRFTVVDNLEVMNQLRLRTMELLAAVVERGELPESHAFFQDIVNGWRDFRADVIFRWAPHLLITSAPRDCASPEVDAIIALSHFELLARNSGLGTLWNGMFMMAMNLAPQLRVILDLPADHLIGFAMSFGKPDVGYKRSVQYGGDTRIKTVQPLV